MKKLTIRKTGAGKYTARLDGIRVVSAELVPYTHSHTYDILPASDTGAYYAGGVLIGSTLRAPVMVRPMVPLTLRYGSSPPPRATGTRSPFGAYSTSRAPATHWESN